MSEQLSPPSYRRAAVPIRRKVRIPVGYTLLAALFVSLLMWVGVVVGARALFTGIIAWMTSIQRT